jgi:Spy/CpxP family protein refolding chaperone
MRNDPSQEERNPPMPSVRERAAGFAAAGVLFTLLVAGTLLTVSCRPHGGSRDDPAKMREHAEWVTSRLLDRVDATEEQRANVRTILDPLFADLAQARLEHRAARTALLAELTGPSIDRAALEALRVERIEAMDALSRRIVEGVADVADELTQEQRQELAELSDRFHRRRHWHR